MRMSKQKNELFPELRFPEFMRSSGWNAVYGNKAFEQVSNKDHNSDLPILAITQEYGAIPREMIDYNVSVTEKSVQSYKVVDIGDFIISLRSFQGGIEYSEYKGLCSPAYVILRNKNGIDKRFFKQYFKTTAFIRDLTKNLEGLRDGKMISYKQFSDVPLPFPHRGEQQKIADFLSSIDELITAHTEKLKALQSYKKGLMQNLFPVEGKTVPALRFPEFGEAGEWELKPFAKFIKLYRGSSPRPIKQYLTKNENGINWIKIGDTSSISDSIIRHVSEKITPLGAEKSRKVRKGELILANSMSYGATYQLELDGCIYDGWFVLREYEDVLDKQFLLQLLNSTYMQEQYKRLAAGGIVQNISSEIVYSTLLPKPSIKEQQRIADCLSSLDDLINSQAKKIEDLKTHKKGLMQQLFPSMTEVR